MTQRPVPAARYSRLLVNEADDKTSSTATTINSYTPKVFLPGILTGALTTLTLFLFAYPLLNQHVLSPRLCVTPYTQQITFSPHPEYANLSHTYDQLWEDVLPSNGGFVKDTLTGGSLGITMFHQLHCLQLLRIGLQSAHEGDTTGKVMDHAGHNMHANSQHYLHCLGYLRQVSHPASSSVLHIVDLV